MKRVRNKLLLIGSVLSSTALFAMSASCANNKEEIKSEQPKDETPNNGETTTPETPGDNTNQPETPSNPVENQNPSDGSNVDSNPQTPPSNQPEKPEVDNTTGSVDTPNQPETPAEGTDSNSSNEETTSNPSENNNNDSTQEQPVAPEVPNQPENSDSSSENEETKEQKQTDLNYIYNGEAIYSLTFLMSDDQIITFNNVPAGYELVEKEPKVIAGQTNNFQVVKTKVKVSTLKKSPVVNIVTSEDAYLGLSYVKNKVETLAFINPKANPVNHKSLSQNDKLLINKLIESRDMLLKDYFVANDDVFANRNNLTFITKLRDENQKVNRYNLSSYIYTIDFLLSDEKYLTDANVEFVLGNKEKVAAMKDIQVQFSTDSNVEIFNRKMKIAGIK